jgi:hypothetical protein
MLFFEQLALKKRQRAALKIAVIARKEKGQKIFFENEFFADV